MADQLLYAICVPLRLLENRLYDLCASLYAAPLWYNAYFIIHALVYLICDQEYVIFAVFNTYNFASYFSFRWC